MGTAWGLCGILCQGETGFFQVAYFGLCVCIYIKRERESMCCPCVDSPDEIKRREVELGCCFLDIVFVTLLRTAGETAII